MSAHFPEASGSVPHWGRLQGLCKRITGLGSCSPLGLKLCPTDFFSSIRNPRVSKLVLNPLVGTSTYGPGPQGGCKRVSSAPSPAGAGSAACGPLGHWPAHSGAQQGTTLQQSLRLTVQLAGVAAPGLVAVGEACTSPVTMSRAHPITDHTRPPSMHHSLRM